MFSVGSNKNSKLFADVDNDAEEDDDEDDISLTSTLVSDQDPDQTYIVDKILASKPDPEVEGGKRYLVKWDGYDENRATWEPVESFDDKKVIADFEAAMNRRKPGDPPLYDWEKWDLDRQREAEEAFSRKQRRENKRIRLGQIALGTPAPKATKGKATSRRSRSTSTTRNFLIDEDDDVVMISDADEDKDTNQSDASDDPALRSRKKKGRRRKPVVADSDDADTGSDSMMEELVSKKKKVGRPRKESRELRGSSEPKKQRVPRLAEVAPGTGKVGPGPAAGPQQRARKTEKLPSFRKKPRSLSPLRTARKARSPSPPPKPASNQNRQTIIQPGSVATYRNLAIANNVRKKSQQERDPAMDDLFLFKPGEGPARKPPPPPAENRPGTSSSEAGRRPSGSNPAGTPANIEDPSSRRRRAVSPPKTPFAPDRPFWEAEPPRRPSSGHNEVQMSPLVPPPMEDVDMLDVAPESLPPPPPLQPLVLECEVEYGPLKDPMATMGNVKFVGFSHEFMSMINECPVHKLWMSKSLENEYLRRFFVPAFGNPLEYVDLEIEGHYEPVVSTLTILHGAGVILHPDFTLLVFQPTNDALRKLFLVPQQKQRTSLRAVAYPPLDESLRALSPTPAPREPLDPGFEHYLPNLLHRFLGMNVAEMVGRVGRGGALCIVYAPKCSRAEQYELESVLKMLGHRVGSYEATPELEKTWGLNKERAGSVRVFVHAALRRQLHIIPFLETYKGLRDVMFWFFGTRFERVGPHNYPVVAATPTRFWTFGTLVLVTPGLVTAVPHLLGAVLQYQQLKAGSTWICVPSTLVALVEAFATDPAGAASKEQRQAALAAAWDLEDRRKRGEAKTLAVEDIPDVNQFELIVDNFTDYMLENCTHYRRFVVVHTPDEVTPTVKAKLYGCIEFCDPAAWKEHFSLQKKPTGK